MEFASVSELEGGVVGNERGEETVKKMMLDSVPGSSAVPCTPVDPRAAPLCSEIVQDLILSTAGPLYLLSI